MTHKWLVGRGHHKGKIRMSFERDRAKHIQQGDAVEIIQMGNRFVENKRAAEAACPSQKYGERKVLPLSLAEGGFRIEAEVFGQRPPRQRCRVVARGDIVIDEIGLHAQEERRDDAYKVRHLLLDVFFLTVSIGVFDRESRLVIAV